MCGSPSTPRVDELLFAPLAGRVAGSFGAIIALRRPTAGPLTLV